MGHEQKQTNFVIPDATKSRSGIQGIEERGVGPWVPGSARAAKPRNDDDASVVLPPIPRESVEKRVKSSVAMKSILQVQRRRMMAHGPAQGERAGRKTGG